MVMCTLCAVRACLCACVHPCASCAGEGNREAPPFGLANLPRPPTPSHTQTRHRQLRPMKLEIRAEGILFLGTKPANETYTAIIIHLLFVQKTFANIFGFF